MGADMLSNSLSIPIFETKVRLNNSADKYSLQNKLLIEK